MLKVLGHLSKNGDDIVREVLAFLGAMLFGGNEEVQVLKDSMFIIPTVVTSDFLINYNYYPYSKV